MRFVKSETIVVSEREATALGAVALMLQNISETATDPENVRSATEAYHSLDSLLDRIVVDTTNRPETTEKPEDFDEDDDENELFACIRKMKALNQ